MNCVGWTGCWRGRKWKAVRKQSVVTQSLSELRRDQRCWPQRCAATDINKCNFVTLNYSSPRRREGGATVCLWREGPHRGHSSQVVDMPEWEHHVISPRQLDLKMKASVHTCARACMCVHVLKWSGGIQLHTVGVITTLLNRIHQHWSFIFNHVQPAGPGTSPRSLLQSGSLRPEG